MTPFRIDIAQADLDDLKARLRRARLPDQLEGSGWDYGTDLDFLRHFIDYWADGFDWRRAETRLNGFPQFITDIDGQAVHFVHLKSDAPGAVPILLANGWPSNFVELLPLALRLATGQAGSAPTAFDVVIPSLPGYGFSSKPKRPGINLTATAGLWAKLMTRLGYDRFLTSASDLGAGAVLALLHNDADRILGAHWCNVYSQYPRPDNPSDAEKAYFKNVDLWMMTEGAYAMEQGTKPSTLAAGLNDSPAGLAAWIIEKFRTWSDSGGDVETHFGIDTLCTIVSIYWFTQTIGSSIRMYKEAFADRERIVKPLPASGVRHAIFVPAACDLPAPREWADRHIPNIVQWTVPGKGGHFPALEVPDLLADDIRAFAHKVVRQPASLTS